MAVILLALGLMCVMEGLVLALAPSRLVQLLEMLSTMPVEARRLLGLIVVTAGGILTAVAAWWL